MSGSECDNLSANDCNNYKEKKIYAFQNKITKLSKSRNHRTGMSIQGRSISRECALTDVDNSDA